MGGGGGRCMGAGRPWRWRGATLAAAGVELGGERTARRNPAGAAPLPHLVIDATPPAPRHGFLSALLTNDDGECGDDGARENAGALRQLVAVACAARGRGWVGVGRGRAAAG